MGIFDLVLIAVVLASMVALLVAAGLAVAGRFRIAGRVLRAWGIGVAAYLGIVVIVSVFRAPRALAVGEDACFDDWCVAVEHVERSPARATQTYAVTFRLSSRARRVSQRERNLVVYLRDERGVRYDAGPVSSGEPFDVLLAPGQSVRTVRLFELPADAPNTHLVIAHEGGFPIGWFIIGEGPFSSGIIVAMR